MHRFCPTNQIHSLDCTYDAEERWVQEAPTQKQVETATAPGYYNFEGAENRRQDSNYNGTMKQYLDHMSEIERQDVEHFAFTSEETGDSLSYSP